VSGHTGLAPSFWPLLFAAPDRVQIPPRYTPAAVGFRLPRERGVMLNGSTCGRRYPGLQCSAPNQLAAVGIG
jgi:hypothetical protein